MLFEATSTRLIKRLAMALLLGIALGIVAMNLFNPARGERLAMLERHHERLTQANAGMERDNVRFARELRALETGADGWRGVARREYGMIFDGEVVFRFPTEPRRARTTTRPAAP